MKKTLLATALAVGFAGAASAQTSVTLYGVLDGGFGYTSQKTTNANGTTTKTRRTGMFDGVQNGNRWGLRGEEDLGGGLKAIFTMEGGFSLARGTNGQSDVGSRVRLDNSGNAVETVSTGSNRIFGRQVWLGLKGDSWGEAKFGRQYGMAGQLGIPTVISSTGDSFASSDITNTFSATSGAVRADNMVSYITPNFSGFKLGLGYSFNYNGSQPSKVTGRTDRDQTYFTVGATYTNGPLTVAAHYDRLNKKKADYANDIDTTFVDVNQKHVHAWTLGASYDFDVAKVHVGYGQHRNGLFGGDPGYIDIAPVSGEFKTNNYSLGFTVPVGDGSQVMLNWQSARLGNGAYRDSVRANGGKTSQNIYSAVYRYDLSKRTNLYVSGAYGTGFAFNNTKVNELTAGLKHSF